MKNNLLPVVVQDDEDDEDEEDEDEEDEDEEDEDEEDEDEDEEGEEDEEAGTEDVLGLDEFWKVGKPKSLPLVYMVPADASGGTKTRTIKHAVDFSSEKSVQKANKTRGLEIWRARDRLGLRAQMKRPSTRGREYNQANNAWIKRTYEQYAANNSGRRIPAAELTRRYNAHFSTENRSVASINSHIDRDGELRAVRKALKR